MSQTKQPEVWLRGPIPEIPPLLQPVAFTYARGEALSAEQRDFLAAEASPGSPPDERADLAVAFERQIDCALKQLRATPDSTLLDARDVGCLQLPSRFSACASTPTRSMMWGRS